MTNEVMMIIISHDIPVAGGFSLCMYITIRKRCWQRGGQQQQQQQLPKCLYYVFCGHNIIYTYCLFLMYMAYQNHTNNV